MSSLPHGNYSNFCAKWVGSRDELGVFVGF